MRLFVVVEAIFFFTLPTFTLYFLLLLFLPILVGLVKWHF